MEYIKTIASNFNKMRFSVRGRNMEGKEIFKKYLIIKILLFIHLMLCILFINNNFYSRSLASFLGPASIIVIGISASCLLFGIVNFYEYRTKQPLSIIVIILVLIFSLFNDNHLVKNITPSKQTFLLRFSDEQYFEHFIHNLNKIYCKKGQQESNQTVDTMPVFIIAVEGGGIRSAFWSAHVLSLIQDTVFKKFKKNFLNHVYAFSTVSGGSVGTGVFIASYAEYQRNYGEKISNYDSLKAFCTSMLSKDFLSALNAGLVFPDMLQNFIPFPIHRFDRSKWLEDKWSDEFSRNIPKISKKHSSHTLDEGFLKFYSDTSFNNFLPALFVNSTQAHTGSKIILCPVRSIFSNVDTVTNLFEQTNKDIPFKTVMSISSRFPLVTPPAMVQINNKKIHLLDGGYEDNSGLTTAILISKNFKKNLNESVKDTIIMNFLKKNILKINFIFISNNPRSSVSTMNNTSKNNLLPELTMPASTFYSTWEKNNNNNFSFAVEYCNFNKINFIEIKLKHTHKVIPLGWFLSPESVLSIRQCSIDNLEKILNQFK
ncbi:MAG: hypothetical protein N3F09_01210 [Bacteroidia bacterium]|nr:hypothetical protein [Bacteroidia bacterium]